MVTYAVQEEAQLQAQPLYLVMMVASQILGTEIPSFEDFCKIESKPQNKRTIDEIEKDFETIITKARESQNGVNL